MEKMRRLKKRENEKRVKKGEDEKNKIKKRWIRGEGVVYV
jgi:hypothetical protein